MNQIIPSIQLPATTSKAVQSLAVEDQQIVIAACGKKLKDINPDEALEEILRIVSASFAIAGFKMPDENSLVVWVNETYKRTLEQYPGITIVEIQHALRNGVYGEYGEFTGLNPKSFMQFVAGYYKSNDRRRAINNYENKKLLEEYYQKLDELKARYDNRAWVNELYREYLTEGLRPICFLLPDYLYKFLVDNGVMTITVDEKLEMTNKAVTFFTDLRAKFKPGHIPKNLSERLIMIGSRTSNANELMKYAEIYAIYQMFEDYKNEGKENIF